MAAELTAARLRELLSYDAETGIFRWRATSSNRAKAGSVAGAVSRGYVQIRIDWALRFAHRLAWLHVHGRWPEGQIDHINGDKGDNRLCNLREVDAAQNQQNQRKARVDNLSSGLLGVSFCKRTGKWQAKICTAGRQRHLGRFDSAEAAHSAYLAAKAEMHPFATITAAAA